MSELRTMLGEMVERLFKELEGSAENEQWPLIEEFGLTNLMLPEALNGLDGTWQDALIVFELLGKYPLPLAIGETIIAKHFIHQATPSAERPLLSGPVLIGECENALIEKNADGGWLFSGVSPWVSAGVQADSLLLQASVDEQTALILVDVPAPENTHSISEDTAWPPNKFEFNRVTVQYFSVPQMEQPSLMEAGALLRTAQISGAMQASLQLAVDYVNERTQFGRPLAKFQVIQHDLARLAEQVAAVKCAAAAASLAADHDPAPFEIAAARLRSNMAVPLVNSIAHQVHGAIGFTREYPLHKYTQSMTAWRSEFGNDRYWANALGKKVLTVGEPSIWQYLTSRTDSISGSL